MEDLTAKWKEEQTWPKTLKKSYFLSSHVPSVSTKVCLKKAIFGQPFFMEAKHGLNLKNQQKLNIFKYEHILNTDKETKCLKKEYK